MFLSRVNIQNNWDYVDIEKLLHTKILPFIKLIKTPINLIKKNLAIFIYKGRHEQVRYIAI